MWAGWAGSTITATRCVPPLTSDAPCRTTQVPSRESTRASATSPGASRPSLERKARPATASTASGSRPSGPIASRELRYPALDAGVAESSPSPMTAPATRGRGGLRDPRLPEQQARRAPCANDGATLLRNPSRRAPNIGSPLSRYRPSAPQTSPVPVRMASLSSLVARQRHVRLPARGLTGISPRRVVQGGKTAGRARDVREPVDVLLQ